MVEGMQAKPCPTRATGVEAASPGDVAAACRCLADAFSGDPLMDYLFGTHPGGARLATEQFFALLLRMRMAVGMPALVMRDGGKPIAAAMGYDTRKPEWPAPFFREWARIETSAPGAMRRMDEYEKIADAFRPPRPHYYLGVIGVDPAHQGRGLGKALLEAFCARSAADARSCGVYLETASAPSLAFYVANGFEVRGEGRLGTAKLSCLFRSNENASASWRQPKRVARTP